MISQSVPIGDTTSFITAVFASFKSSALAASTIYKMVREKSIPAPIRVGTTATRWRADEIKNYLDERPRSLDVPAPQHANKTKAAV